MTSISETQSKRGKEKVRLGILSAAREVFERYGYKKSTLEDIALAAKKGKSSIYYYYESKEDIFRAVVEHEACLLFNELSAYLKEDLSPKEKIKGYILKRMLLVKSMANYYNALKNEYLKDLSFVSDTRSQFEKEEISNLAYILNEGKGKGVFEVADPVLTASVIATAMHGMEVRVLENERSEEEIEEKLTSLMEVLFYGIAKK